VDKNEIIPDKMNMGCKLEIAKKNIVSRAKKIESNNTGNPETGFIVFSMILSFDIILISNIYQISSSSKHFLYWRHEKADERYYCMPFMAMCIGRSGGYYFDIQ